MMRRYIHAHLTDPGFTVQKLARRHRVSVRRTYALFEQAGSTPAAYLREQRLLEAGAMPSDPACNGPSVTDISAAVGFAEDQTFRLAFKRQYGTTPALCRRELQAPRTEP
jgi:AraC-like DNA-binding protein